MAIRNYKQYLYKLISLLFVVLNNRLVVSKQNDCINKNLSQFKLNNAGYLSPWGPMDPMVYDVVFIFLCHIGLSENCDTLPR